MSSVKKGISVKLVVKEVQTLQEIDEMVDRCCLGQLIPDSISEYKRKHFDEDGNRKNQLSFFSDTIYAVKYRGKVVGFVHFYTDYSDAYQNILESLVIRPNLNPILKRAVKKLLERIVEESEP